MKNWVKQNQTTFHKLQHKDQVNFLASLTTFNKPKNVKNSRKWMSNSGQTINQFPKTYDLTIPGPNGFDKYRICGGYFQHLFSI